MKNKKGKSPKKEEEQFPGYPKYPADEDIMNRNQRVLLDDKGVEGSGAVDLQNGLPDENALGNSSPTRKPDPLDPENDVKSDDLKDRVYPVDFSGKDLDVPGTELDDESEETGNEDEENNLYSGANED